MTKIKLNNLEISQEDLVREIQNNPEMMEMLQEKFGKKEGWFVPKVEEDYFGLHYDGDVFSYCNYDNIRDKKTFAFQKVYRTKEEAQQAFLRQQAKIRILKTIAEENAKVGWVCDWGCGDQNKLTFYYSHFHGDVEIICEGYSQKNETDFYFAEEIKDIILEKCAEDYKIYLGIR